MKQLSRRRLFGAVIAAPAMVAGAIAPAAAAPVPVPVPNPTKADIRALFAMADKRIKAVVPLRRGLNCRLGIGPEWRLRRVWALPC